jgi:hypothetical protein
MTAFLREAYQSAGQRAEDATRSLRPLAGRLLLIEHRIVYGRVKSS